MEEKYVFPLFEKIILKFPNHEEAKNKLKEFNKEKFCIVEGVDWEKAQIDSEDLKIKGFSNVGKTFTAAGGRATPTENPETTTGTHPTGTEETGNTSEPETTGTPPEPATTGASAQTPEPNTTPPPKPISVYDYFETKSGLINEDHVDSQRKFIKYGFLKNKLKEIYPQSQGSQNDNPPPGGGEPAQTRKNAIQTITAALNLEPVVKESELNAEFQG
ncbi:8662_t:CDS:2 [Ambispora leptoticha]|uniref:8662_t:CDS:1 n=1 Tax=Ambispora leptoticha TaxID=144679 RepID=A0A9N9N6W5_9GLOM|nr:8662_t:CDS:2 [Ambispora leptoticha]